MGRKGESIFLRSDGRYEGRYIKDYDEFGKAIYGYVYAKTYNECKKKRMKVISYDKDIDKSNNNGSKNDLNYLIDKWLETKKGRIKESSYSRYFQLVDKHIRKDIGKVKISKLNSDIINDFLIKKLENGKLDKSGGLSKNSVYDISLIIKQVLKSNKIKLDIVGVSKSVGKGKSFYSNERVNLENHLMKYKDSETVGILLSLLLGLREGEICGLRWEDVDLDNKIIHINRTVTRVKSFNTKNKTKLVITTPKTESSIRDLPIPDKIYDNLVRLKKGVDEGNYLLTMNNKCMDPRTYYNHYKRILKEICIIDHTYHDLRHTFATNCIELGIDAKTLMELLGHNNISTTLNIYVHGSLDNKRSFVNKL